MIAPTTIPAKGPADAACVGEGLEARVVAAAFGEVLDEEGAAVALAGIVLLGP